MHDIQTIFAPCHKYVHFFLYAHTPYVFNILSTPEITLSIEKLIFVNKFVFFFKTQYLFKINLKIHIFSIINSQKVSRLLKISSKLIFFENSSNFHMSNLTFLQNSLRIHISSFFPRSAIKPQFKFSTDKIHLISSS